MQLTKIAAALAVVLSVAISMPLAGQTRSELAAATQIDIQRASDAVRAAETMGAPLYAKELYDEANRRLTWARTNWEDKRRDVREDAKIRAVEAFHAARAAEAVARLVNSRREALNLRENIVSLGGKAEEIRFRETDLAPIERGSTSKQRVNYAESIVQRARLTRAEVVAPEDMRTAASNLQTAQRLAKLKTNNDAADHLAFVAEMLARRAEALALRNEAEAVLPGLRIERSRVAEAATAARAQQEREARELADRQAADLRRQLAEQQANRQAEAEELARLRQQIEERNRQLEQQFQSDRQARLEAEQRLEALRMQYQTAIGSTSDSVELENLRRQVEDQSIALRTVQERERSSEAAMAAEIERLRGDLQAERARGGNVAEREATFQRQQEELTRMRTQREEAERVRAERERAYTAAIDAAERQRRQSESEAAQLRQQVAEQTARAQQAETALSQTRAEMQRREEMQRALSAIASTRTDTRGIIVTLPGIFFATGKSSLTPGAQNTLAKIADQLKGTQSLRVAVEGHTDSVGGDEMNRQLSLRRAEAVRDYLVTHGIAASSVTVDGKGETAPVAPNTTASGRQQNRRVELVIAP